VAVATPREDVIFLLAQKHDKRFFSKKNQSGLITKNVAFFLLLFFFTHSCFARFFFIAFLGVSERLVTRTTSHQLRDFLGLCAGLTEQAAA
jgi:hypothetical protein